MLRQASTADYFRGRKIDRGALNLSAAARRIDARGRARSDEKSIQDVSDDNRELTGQPRRARNVHAFRIDGASGLPLTEEARKWPAALKIDRAALNLSASAPVLCRRLDAVRAVVWSNNSRRVQTNNFAFSHTLSHSLARMGDAQDTQSHTRRSAGGHLHSAPLLGGARGGGR